MEKVSYLLKWLLRLFVSLLVRILKLFINLLTMFLSVLSVFCISYGIKTALTDHIGLGLLLVAAGVCCFFLTKAFIKAITEVGKYLVRRKLSDGKYDRKHSNQKE